MNSTIPTNHHRLLAAWATVPACQTHNGDADWFPAVDISENGEEYLFEIDLPATKPEDIQVVVEEDGLYISGERPQPWQENKKWLRVERPHGRFERRFVLPDDASRVEISSAFSGDVLELHVRKVKPAVREPPSGKPSLALKLRSAT